MSILITGGSGLIGASPAQMIVDLGERPAIFDIAPFHPILRKIDSKFKYFQRSLDPLSFSLHQKGLHQSNIDYLSYW
jgi:UDP-glucose 4-epimerase